MTTQALDELAGFVENALQRLSGYNILSDHLSPETAGEVVSQFRAGSSNSLQLWGDPIKAPANVQSLCTSLGLTYSPATSVVTCVSDANHITHEILESLAAAERKLYRVCTHQSQFRKAGKSYDSLYWSKHVAGQSMLLVVNGLP